MLRVASMDTIFCCFCCFIHLISLIFDIRFKFTAKYNRTYRESPYTIPRSRTRLASPVVNILHDSGPFLLGFFFSVPWFSFERESMHACEQPRGRGRGGKESCAVSTEPDAGLDPMNCEIMTWAQIQTWTLNQLSHPGTLTTVVHFLWTRTLHLEAKSLMCNSVQPWCYTFYEF